MKTLLLIDDNVHTPNKGAPLFNMEMEYFQKKNYKVYSLGFSESLNYNSGEINLVKLPANKILLKYNKFIGSKYIQNENSTSKCNFADKIGKFVFLHLRCLV